MIHFAYDMFLNYNHNSIKVGTKAIYHEKSRNTVDFSGALGQNAKWKSVLWPDESTFETVLF